ncbi:ABC transporter substrate-binding protein [Shumkonia mesophila]|uniref:ABC transporter substrate-binding protein n=1 Tax=Shumkonia mesophila TaxID=2838854 RepID=UPI00293515D6|nr:ABC transporter substrate-binding protein [Shumkonia mesophila]
MKTRAIVGALCAVGLLSSGPMANAEDLEVLHWWTSGGESKAVGVLKDMMEKQGYVWKDFAVAGGAGSNAMKVLKARVLAGTPPTATQIKGVSIDEWAEEGVLANIDAATKGWDKEIPPAITKFLNYKGHYVAAPFWVHRLNWLYINKKLLDQVGGTPPTTWPEFFVLANKLKAAGIIPLAHGGQPWQDINLWEGVVLSKGADFYNKTIVDLDHGALTSATMIDVFDTVRKIASYFDPGTAGRSWNLSSAMVIQGKAAMQMMGDWAKGEFLAANLVAGKDYLCVPRPGTAKLFMFNSDSFMFFKKDGSDAATKGQVALAETITSKDFQHKAAYYKGAIPARSDVSMDGFDSCAQKSHDDFVAAIKDNALIPSLAHGMVQRDATLGAMRDVVTHFVNSNEDSKTAVQKLAQAAKVM